MAGAVLAAGMLLTIPFIEQIGFEYGALIGYSTMTAAFLAIYFGVRAYRDTTGGGHVAFGRALVVGLLITLVASACYVVTWQVVYFAIVPDFAERYGAYAVEQARLAGQSAAQIEATERDMAEFARLYRNPLYNLALTLLEPLPVGLVFSFVTAGLLGRRGRSGIE